MTDDSSQSTNVHPNRPAVPDALIGFALVLLTLAALHSILGDDFIKYDDRQYVTDNPHVVSGLTWQNFKWAFTTGYASNWHPVTWLSHMVDVQLFGLKPSGHHFTSLFLHIANTVLLFLLLRQMTGALWRCAIVAALFAVHPLHVESVAWVAERKDVLSTFFFLLTLGAYTGYAKSKTRRLDSFPPVTEPPGPESPQSGAPATGSVRRAVLFYFLALLLFALGLMSKPMLVTVPFLLLLLDWWPLGRVPFPMNARAVLRLVAEKIPFLGLTVASSIVTYLAQAGAHSVIAGLPLYPRTANAIVSYLKYLGKTFWPANLAIFYPHPNTRFGLSVTAPGYPVSEQWPFVFILLAALFLASISILALLQARRRPWFFTGWFWFVGTLVPVIGLVQVGMQAMADRYTYIPLIGVFIAIVWGISDLFSSNRLSLNWAGACAAVLIALCAVITHRQAGYWRNNFSVFDHALKVTRHNAIALCNVGEELAQQGKPEQAQDNFRAAINADPRLALAYMDLALSLETQGKPDQALPNLQATVRLRPWSEVARNQLADVLESLGRHDEALAQYNESLKLNPNQPFAQYHIGMILAAQAKLPDAQAHLLEATRLKPDFTDAYIQQATLLAGQGKFLDAQVPFRQALSLCPTNAQLHLQLGQALMLAGQKDQAAPEFAAALRLEPDLADKLLQEGQMLSSRGQLNAALARFNTALWLKPDSASALSAVAWILATHPRSQFRNGQRALQMAKRALELSGGKEPRLWAALDAAYAETGQFVEAINAAEKGRELAISMGDQQAVQATDARLALYRNQKPFHQ